MRKPNRNPHALEPTDKTTRLQRMTADKTILSWLQKLQPPDRETCRNGPRPCPHVHCVHHLYYKTEEVDGEVRVLMPEKELWELGETCSLDRKERENRHSESSKAQALATKPTPPSGHTFIIQSTLPHKALQKTTKR
ncbi:MAG: hypothetical protein CL920_38750 [Deltaproteobacteria bacterium]|nr:hypothetical protein [Deltaproteobacteria bacterium]